MNPRTLIRFLRIRLSHGSNRPGQNGAASDRDPAMGENLRRFKRLKWNREGEILSLVGKRIATCLVKDISINGARLEVRTAEKLPDCFRLDYGGDEQPKCSVRWRNGNEMGVQFLLRPQLPARLLKGATWPALVEFLASRR